MSRRVLAPLFALIIAASLVAGPPSVAAVIPTVHLEAQAWWAIEGLDVPRVVGHHIHVEALNFPKPGTIVDGVYVLRVRITLHDQAGKTNWIRVSDGDNTFPTIPFVMGPCDDCSREVDVPIDFGDFATGVREVRLSVNVPDEQPDASGSQRMFNSTGWPVAVRSLSGCDRDACLKFVEARGWYTLHDYQNARADRAEVAPGDLVAIRIGPGSGGEPTRFSGAFINPKMHDADPGRVIDLCPGGNPMGCDGPFTGTFRVPADLVAGDKIALVGSDRLSDGSNGVVLVLRVGGSPAPTPTPTVAPTPQPTLPPSPSPSC